MKIFNDPGAELYTNELALKELYHVLKDDLGFSELEIGYAVDYIRAACVVLPTPSKKEITKIQLRDRSDRPFVFSAQKYDLVLCVDDEKTFQDAKKYVKVKRITKD